MCVYTTITCTGLSPDALWVALKKSVARDRERKRAVTVNEEQIRVVCIDLITPSSISPGLSLGVSEDRCSKRGQRSLRRSGTPQHEVCVCADRASVLQVVLPDAMCGQFSHHVVQIVGVGVAVAREVGAELRLVVNLVPHDRVHLSRGAGHPDGEDQTTVPRHD